MLSFFSNEMSLFLVSEGFPTYSNLLYNFKSFFFFFFFGGGGGSGGAKVLGKLAVPGCLTNSDNSRPRAYCTCSRCGLWLGTFFSLVYLFSVLSPSVGDGPIYTEILSQRAVKPKQPTNKPKSNILFVRLYLISKFCFIVFVPFNFFLPLCVYVWEDV